MLSPITFAEFLSALKACQVPGGWGKRIAVAYSGGPDSTCLLFLLQSVLSNTMNKDSVLPASVHALSVNHGLQAAANAMGEHCTNFTSDRDIAHTELSISWGKAPFPDKPASNQAFERIARSARQRLLLDWMAREEVSILATGHHADDNVETLTLGQLRSENSRQIMDPWRRWGMGDHKNSSSFVGLPGMQAFIIRPLLPFSKDRILVTCDEHKLSYVVDQTNFQPDLTPRNAVRKVLAEEGNMPLSDFRELATLYPLPEVIPDDSTVTKRLSTWDSRNNILQALTRLVTQRELAQPGQEDPTVAQALRSLVGAFSREKAVLDLQALEYLEQCRYPSPDSTFLLLSARVPDGKELQRAILYRIIRFVSPFPWGSIASQAHRDTAAIDAVASEIWYRRPSDVTPFTRGGLVKWTPVVVREDGKIKLANKRLPIRPLDRHGWLTSRQPAYIDLESGRSSNCSLDVSTSVVTALRDGNKQQVDVLFDCRFIVRIFPSVLPDYCRNMLLSGEGSLVLRPVEPYCQPSLQCHPVRGAWTRIPKSEGDVVHWQGFFIREL